MSELGLSSISWLQGNIFLFALCFSLALAGGMAAIAKMAAMFELSPSASGDRAPDTRAAPTRRPPRWLDLAMAVLAGAAIIGWLALSVSWEAFTFWDNHHFFGPLRGEPQQTPPPIYTGIGRFFPLGHQEFEWLGLVDGSGFFYRVFFCFQLVTVCVLSVRLVRAGPYLSILMIIAISLTPEIFLVFTQLIFTERNMIFLLAIYLFFVKRYIDTGSILSLSISTISISLIALYKETAFVILVVLGSFFFVPVSLSKDGANRRRYRIAAVPPFLVSILFLSYYYGVIDPLVVNAYGDGRVRPLNQLIERAIAKPWIWVLALSLGIRVWQFIRTGGRIDPFWDGVGAASCAFFAVYIALGYDALHFYAPAAYAAWLFGFRITQTLRPSRGGSLFRSLFVAFIAAMVIAQLTATWNGFRSRKELVHSKASAARFVADYASTRGFGTAKRPLYVHPLPSANFAGGLFGGYIRAKYDINVVVALSDPSAASGGSCFGRVPVRCVFRPKPQPGELVVAMGRRGARDLKHQDGLKLLFVSEDIGFWRNRQRVSVSVAEER